MHETQSLPDTEEDEVVASGERHGGRREDGVGYKESLRHAPLTKTPGLPRDRLVQTAKRSLKGLNGIFSFQW